LAKTLLLIVTLIVLLFTTAASAVPSKPLSDYSAHIWKMEDGLPQNNIEALAQTPDGYIWIGTREGLTRFDGVRFTTFTTRDTPALASNDIRELLADRSGRLWILAGNAVTCLSGGEFIRIALNNVTGETVQCIWLGEDANVMAASTHTILRFDGYSMRPVARIGADVGLQGNIAHDARGRIWFLDSSQHVECVDDGIVSVVNEGRILARCFAVDSAGAVWIGGATGIYRIAKGVYQDVGTRSAFHLRVDRIVCDSAGNVWVLSKGAVYRWTGSKLVSPSIFHCAGLTVDSIGRCWGWDASGHIFVLDKRGPKAVGLTVEADSGVLPIVNDSEGDMWIGTDNGLYCLQNLPGRTYGLTDGLPDTDIVNTCTDGAGRLWVGTVNGGIAMLRDGKFVSPPDKRLASGFCPAMAGAPGRDFWVKCHDRIYQMHTDHFVDMTERLSLSDGEMVQTMAVDHAGLLWLGTSRGVIQYDGHQPRRIDEQGASTDSIHVIYVDPVGGVWIGRDRTLTRYFHGKMQRYASRDGLPADSPVISIAADIDGNGWIGTWGAGLYRLHEGKITGLTVKNGLASNNILQILQDDAGYLWIGSTKGVFRVEKRALDDVVNGRRSVVISDVYDADYGLNGGVCCQGLQPSSVRDSRGTLWFGAHSGLERIDPESHTLTSTHAKLERVLLNRSEWPVDRTAVVPPGDGAVEINYTALSFAASHRIEFRYRLVGYDKEWMQVGTRRTAYYTSVPAGFYRFEVQAFDRDGTPFGSPASYKFRLRPHIYEELWFKLSIALIVTLLGSLIAVHVAASLKRHNVELESLVADRSRDLSVSNAVLSDTMEELAAQNEELEAMQAEIEARHDELTGVKALLEAQNADLANANVELEALATEDALTGLKNRRVFMERVDRELAFAERYGIDLSVVIMDVDNFKSYNDTFGHPAGDEVLKAVSGAMLECVRETDLAARYGGEEFCIVLPHTDRVGAAYIAERCRQLIERLTGLQRTITVSVGVASARDISKEGVDSADLVNSADQALYHSKKSGKNRVTDSTQLERPSTGLSEAA